MSKTHALPRTWTVADSLETYGVKNWGGVYFTANEKGELIVMPSKNEAETINLPELVDEVRRRGIGLPLLIRFPDILKARIVELNESFRSAIVAHSTCKVHHGAHLTLVSER